MKRSPSPASDRTDGAGLPRDAAWISLDEQSVEHVRLQAGTEGIVADGVVIHRRETGAFRLRYLITCDRAWRVRAVEVRHLDVAAPALTLRTDGLGRWTTSQGEPVEVLRGCGDLDLSYSPFTNTLAIRRLALEPGGAAEITAAFVTVPDLGVQAVRQRYTRLKSTAAESVYRYEAVESGFAADLVVDGDGLVIEYPGYFRRASDRPREGGAAIRLLPADGPVEEYRDRLMLYGQFVGSWDLEGTWYTDDKVTRTMTGEWHFGWVLGGRGVQDVIFRAGAPAREYGTTIRCYDPAHDVWHVTFMQPAGGEYVHLTGRQVGDRIVQEVIQADPHHRERWSFTEITPHSFLWRGETSTDGGGTWVVAQELRGRRRADPAAR